MLTDGRLVYGAEGEELKVFDVKDGLALQLARRVGLQVGILSARSSPALARRAEDLALDAVLAGRDDKLGAFEGLLAERGVAAGAVAYAGDDLGDLPILTRCGLAFAPADAAAEARDVAHRVLARPGGHGAVREMVEILLKARGEWEDLVNRFRVERA